MEPVGQKERTGTPDRQEHQNPRTAQNPRTSELRDRVSPVTFQKDDTETQREEVTWDNRAVPLARAQIPGLLVPGPGFREALVSLAFITLTNLGLLEIGLAAIPGQYSRWSCPL